MIKKLLILMMFVIVASLNLAAHPAFAVRAGLRSLKEGRLEEAESELQKAAFAAPDNPVVKYNLGHLSYRKRQYNEAGRYFAEVAEKAKTEDLKFKAFHNLGNAAYRGHNFALAVDAYKQGLEIKEDEKTRYNLTQAEEKLKQQMEQEQQQKSDSEEQKDKQGSQQGDKQQGDQQQNDSQDNQQSGKQGDKQQGEKDQQSGEQGDKQQGEKDQQSGEQGDKQESDKQQGQQEQNSKSEQQKEDDSKKAGQQQEEQKQRQDVEMAQSEEQKGQPQASQRARALKNRKLNPYMVEKILKELQERERQAQLYYRNDPQPRRQEQLDPFNMDAQQLNEFFRNRGRPQQQKKDEPDW